jgi:hypothetical protein
MNNPGNPLPKIKENIVEYLKPDIEMYNNARERSVLHLMKHFN